jgi:hypothetical protein
MIEEAEYTDVCVCGQARYLHHPLILDKNFTILSASGSAKNNCIAFRLEEARLLR